MLRLLLPAGLVSLLLLTACAPKPTAVSPANQASAYFQEGEIFFEKGLYADAIASWEKVRQTYYSPDLNILAELMIAETYFVDEKYVEAAAAYEAFLKNHPDHPKAAEALYRLGLANLRQMLAPDQDQTFTRQALVAFRTFLQRYPEASRREEVQSYIDHCLYQLAANELVVGRYYLKAGHYQAAISRFEGVGRQFPGHYDSAEVYYHLGRAYLLAGDSGRSGEAFALLFSQFPASDYARDAEVFLSRYN